jgi:hypothetical protein
LEYTARSGGGQFVQQHPFLELVKFAERLRQRFTPPDKPFTDGIVDGFRVELAHDPGLRRRVRRLCQRQQCGAIVRMFAESQAAQQMRG